MAVSRIETALVLGFVGTIAAGVSIGVYYVTTMPMAPKAEKPAVAPTSVQSATGTPKFEPAIPLGPFIATVENEGAWRPDNLPVAWPKFSVLPNEKPLPAKPTKAKIDTANALNAKASAYFGSNGKDLPSPIDAGTAIKYLLTIDRADPAFPDAWAAFIKLRQTDRDISREVARLDAAKMLQKTEAERKRIAKTQGVHVGMTKEEVLGSNWGKPEKVNTTINSYGRHEQWVYHGSNYLYFDNDHLTSIQTGR
jgi:hypothetical protein